MLYKRKNEGTTLVRENTPLVPSKCPLFLSKGQEGTRGMGQACPLNKSQCLQLFVCLRDKSRGQAGGKARRRGDKGDKVL